MIDEMDQVHGQAFRSFVALRRGIFPVQPLATARSQPVQPTIEDDFKHHSHRPEQRGWSMASVFILIVNCSLMQALTRLLDSILFPRLIATLLFGVPTLMLMLLVQIMMGEKVYSMADLVDALPHIAGILLVFLTICWGKSDKDFNT
ncbi:MAG: hypothetical protein V4858_09420 [Pseudomonadota bacterium]